MVIYRKLIAWKYKKLLQMKTVLFAESNKEKKAPEYQGWQAQKKLGYSLKPLFCFQSFLKENNFKMYGACSLILNKQV